MAFNDAEREAIVRAVRERPRQFAELYDVLRDEIKRKRARHRDDRF